MNFVADESIDRQIVDRLRQNGYITAFGICSDCAREHSYSSARSIAAQIGRGAAPILSGLGENK